MALALAGVLLWHGSAQAQVHRAALVVQHGPSWPGQRLLWKCVQFAQNSISGLALLELAGVNSGQPPQVYDWGGGAVTVCQVDQEPRAVPDRCFGPTSGRNWSDSYRSPAGWVPRAAGATGYSVRDGDMEGWTYASGFGGQPPAVSFDQVCPAVPPTAATAATARPQTSRAVTSGSAPPTSTSTAAAHTTPSPEALIPTSSAGGPRLLPVTADPPSGPPSHPPTGLLVIGAALLGLGGLATWNWRLRKGR